MCILIFSVIFVWNIFHSKNNWARYDTKSTTVFTQSTLYSCPILMKPEYSQHFSSTITQIPNFTKIRPVVAELFREDRRMDVHAKADSFF